MENCRKIKYQSNYRFIENTSTSPILQISSNGNKKPQRNSGGIYAFPRIIFIRFADVRCKLLWWWVHSRNPSFSYFSHCVRQCTKYVNSRVRQLKKLYVPNWLDGEQTSIYGFTWTNSILFGMHSKLFLLEGEKSICVIFFPHNLVISICQRWKLPGIFDNSDSTAGMKRKYR